MLQIYTYNAELLMTILLQYSWTVNMFSVSFLSLLYTPKQKGNLVLSSDLLLENTKKSQIFATDNSLKGIVEVVKKRKLILADFYCRLRNCAKLLRTTFPHTPSTTPSSSSSSDPLVLHQQRPQKIEHRPIFVFLFAYFR